MRFLIVDDNSEMREMIKFYLRNFSPEFCECADGSHALSNFTVFQPDWVLMDWEMKKMDGITATKQIIKDFPKANICMVTSYDDRELRTAAVDAGALGFVVKDDLSKLRDILAD